MPVWTLVLCDLRGRPIGELRAKARALSFPLNGIPSGSLKLRLDNPFADQILSTDALVKAYEDDTLKGVYDIASAEEVVQGTADDGVAVVLAAPWARMASRMIGKNDTGVTVSSADRGRIAQGVVALTNADDYSGIDIGDFEASAPDTAGPWYFKTIAEANGELSGALDGYDWDVTPVEPQVVYTPPGTPRLFQLAPSWWPAGLPWLGGGETEASSPNPANKPTVGQFNTYAVKGFFRANAIFEYGTGRHNVRSYRRPVDRTKMLNRGWSLPQGFPDVQVASTIIESEDTDAIATRGLYEGLVAGDLVVDELRQALVTEHVRIRSAPRQLILFESHIEDPDNPGRVPRFGVDYDVGDVVPARAKVNGVVRFDAYLRIYGVDLAISDEGTATPTLQLVTQ